MGSCVTGTTTAWSLGTKEGASMTHHTVSSTALEQGAQVSTRHLLLWDKGLGVPAQARLCSTEPLTWECRPRHGRVPRALCSPAPCLGVPAKAMLHRAPRLGALAKAQLCSTELLPQRSPHQAPNPISLASSHKSGKNHSTQIH